MASVLDSIAIWAAPLIMALTSIVYFRASPQTSPLQLRLLVSAHGVVSTLLFVGAFAVASLGSAKPAFREPFLALWLVPVALVIFSLARFAGSRRTHLLLVPLGFAMLWACALAFTVVGGGK